MSWLKSIEGPTRSAILSQLLVTPANPGQGKLTTRAEHRTLDRLNSRREYMRLRSALGILFLVSCDHLS
ncbi:hypothetical protein [Paenibacillus massiliensis]|uniref:hypothetical protein n=1 Tax=Paenibacillus massiliensis TaxID=225917 RepID=UPI0012B55CA4|nr:hypothetical protein [Paenibacillus massiliensis]